MKKNIKDHFKKIDPILYKLIHKIKHIELKESDDYFVSLCESIISQQLSVKASDTIFKRFESLFPNNKIDPSHVLLITNDELRSVGMSNAKAAYIKDLAQKVIDQTVDLSSLRKLTDEEVIKELTRIKGIGRWTAEMFLMFSLAREDIFSYGDLGLKNALKKFYNLTNPTVSDIEKLISYWAPYKTYACITLWRALSLPNDG